MSDLTPRVAILKSALPMPVLMFRLNGLPVALQEALGQMETIEREVSRLRPLASVEDQGDRETLLALYAAADKTVSSHAERVGSHLRSLS